MDPLRPTDPPEIGGYRLTARLGAGGMGQVYLARTASGRKLVVKVIRPEFAAEDGFRARFAREAEAARRVGGFHTVQMVDADPGADPPWIATAYIPGPTLEQTVRTHGPLPPSALHALAMGLAEGLKAVHACDLVHRDLKPANIILAEDGPRIIDFGIARPLDADSMTTQGAVFGTLPYMSPEQTDGSRVGPASDMFSLGTVLAYAATGTSPFSGATMAETLRRLIGPPPALGGIDPDIRALVQECWDHDPGRRPAPDRVLARLADLDADGSRPSAGQDSAGGRPETATVVLGPRPRPESARPPAIRPVRSPGGTPDPGSAAPRRPRPGRTVSIGIVTVCLLLLGVAVFYDNTGSQGTADENGPVGRTLFGEHEERVNALAFAPDGTVVATGGDDGVTRLWDPGTGGEVTTITGHTRGVTSVAFNPAEDTLATGSADGSVRLWDARTGARIDTFIQNAAWVSALAFSADGTLLAAGGQHRTVWVWDARTGEEVTTIRHESWVRSVAFSPDSGILAAGGDTTLLSNPRTGEEVAEFTAGGATSVAFSPDGGVFATGGWNGTVRLWDTDTYEERLATFPGGDVVAFGADGTFATGSRGGAVRLRGTDRREIGAFPGHTGEVLAVAFSPDGTGFATSGADLTVRFWKVEDASPDGVSSIPG